MPDRDGTPVASALLHAEDLVVGSVLELGEHHLAPEEVTAFARRWDPLPIHLDADDPDSIYGSVIASGLHTLSVMQRLAVDGAYGSWAIVAGRALREVRFVRPVPAGSTLSCRLTVRGVEMAHPDRAVVALRLEARCADRLAVVSDVETWVRRRLSAPGAPGRR